jgi:lysyl-tRNA synthetase class 1
MRDEEKEAKTATGAANQNQPQTTAQAVDEPLGRHWADHAADELLRRHAGKSTLVCASGISPSGIVHIGNFREVITVDLVVRALRERGKNVRFIYSWDDYDAFRKVPANLPQKEMLEQNLRRPISDVPDPFGQEKSYAGQFEKRFESEISQLGIRPEYLYQNEAYRACRYTEGIRTALKNEKAIVAILDQYRTSPLESDWSCVSIFCEGCGKDVTRLEKYEEPTTLHYYCKICKTSRTIDFAKQGGVKLLWRVDWPMRWAHETVDFEPGGKDHSSQGGSYETGARIIREVWKKEPPFYVQYDFVLAKGLGAKLSSSSGQLITLGEALEIYEPQVIRWIFASRKPNLDFTIAFDLDVMKAYDDFDRCERFAFGREPGEEKKVSYERRIYELSCVEPPGPDRYERVPPQFAFRHLCNTLQIHEGDLEKAKAYFADSLQTPEDQRRFEDRAVRAWKWIRTFAPPEFKFALQTNPDHGLKTLYPQAIRDLIALLEKPGTAKVPEDELANAIFEVMKRHQLEAKVFFQEVYGLLIGKKNGPKLASFLLAMGPSRAAEILKWGLP